MTQKSLNDEERGGNYLLVPERSYGPGILIPNTIAAGSNRHVVEEMAGNNLKVVCRAGVFCCRLISSWSWTTGLRLENSTIPSYTRYLLHALKPHCQCALVRKYFWNIASLHTGSAVHFKQIGEVFRDGSPHQSTTF